MTRMLASLALALGAGTASAQGLVDLVSQSSEGVLSTGDSHEAAISVDGRFVVFRSSGNLAPGSGAPGSADMFLRDRVTRTTERVSMTWNGGVPDQGGYELSVSADGRYVCYVSGASNLVPDDDNGRIDLFVRDRQAGTTILVSLTTYGTPIKDYVHGGSIAAESPWVVFESAASNVVSDDTNGIEDVFVRNFVTGEVERISRRSDGTQAAKGSRDGSISGDGRIVAFASFDRLHPDDVNDDEDVYVLDRQSGELRLASHAFDGAGGEGGSFVPALSVDGSTVVFTSHDRRLVAGSTDFMAEVFWCDLVTDVVGRASVTSTGASPPFIQDGYGKYSTYPSVSGDGRIVGFWSSLTGLVPNVPGMFPAGGRVYTHDRVTGATTLVDTTSNGVPGDSDCFGGVSISADGSWVAWSSASSNLVADDGPGGDIFVRRRATDRPTIFCRPKVNSLGCSSEIAWSGTPSVGSGLPFTLTASNMIGASTGFLLYGLTPQNVPFAGGRLCVAAPVHTTDYAGLGGSPGACTGSLSVDFNTIVRSGLDPSLMSGAVVFAQFCYRDYADPVGLATGLSDAIMFTIRP